MPALTSHPPPQGQTSKGLESPAPQYVSTFAYGRPREAGGAKGLWRRRAEPQDAESAPSLVTWKVPAELIKWAGKNEDASPKSQGCIQWGMQGVPRDTWRRPNFKGLQAAFLSLLAAGRSLMYFCWALSHLELPPRVELVSNKSQEAYPSQTQKTNGSRAVAGLCLSRGRTVKTLVWASCSQWSPLKRTYPGDGGGGVRTQSQVPPRLALTQRGSP